MRIYNYNLVVSNMSLIDDSPTQRQYPNTIGKHIQSWLLLAVGTVKAELLATYPTQSPRKDI